MISWAITKWSTISPVASVPGYFYFSVIAGLIGGCAYNFFCLCSARKQDFISDKRHQLWKDGILYRLKLSALHRISSESGDPKFQTVWRALVLAKLIMVTLKSGKVYIGSVSASLDPTENAQWLKIIPIASGFRDKESHSYIPTTDYRSLFDELACANLKYSPASKSESNGSLMVDLLDLGMVISWSEVVSLTIYDPGLEQYFSAQSEEDSSSSSDEQIRVASFLDRALSGIVAFLKGRRTKEGLIKAS